MVGEKNNLMEGVNLEDKVNLILNGLSVLVLTLLSSQLFLLFNKYFDDTNILIMTLMGTIGALMGIVEGKMLKGIFNWSGFIRVMAAGFLMLLTFLFNLSLAPLELIPLAMIVLLIYQLGYQLVGYAEELIYDFGEEDQKNHRGRDSDRDRLYNRHLISFKKLIKEILVIDMILVISWLIIDQISSSMTIIGLAIFFLQFIMVGTAFYQRKRITWTISGYQLSGNIYSKMIGWIVIITMALSVFVVFLPVKYSPVPWKWIGHQLSRLLNGYDGEISTTYPQQMTVERREQRQRKEGEPIGDKVDLGASGYIMWAGIGLMSALLLFIMVGAIFYWIDEQFYRLQGFPGLILRFFNTFLEIVKGWANLFKQGVMGIKENIQTRRRERLEKKLKSTLEGEDKNQQRNWIPSSPGEKIIAQFIDLVYLLRGEGVVRKDNHTLTDYLENVAKEYSETEDLIEVIRNNIERVLYSDHQITVDNLKEMEKAINRFKREKGLEKGC